MKVARVKRGNVAPRTALAMHEPTGVPANSPLTVALVTRNVNKLRELSPLWEMHLDGVDLSKVQWAAH